MSVCARRRRPAMHALAVFALVVLAALPAGAQDESDLASAREQISAIEAELERANAASHDAKAELARARKALERIEAVVNAVAQRVQDQEDRVRAARSDLDRLREQEGAARHALQVKAVELYKHAGLVELGALADARDLQSAIDRSTFLHLVGRHDTARIEDLDGAVRRRAAAAEVLAREQDALDALLADQEAVMVEAERARRSRALAAAAAEDEVAELEAEHDHLTDLEDEIEQAIAERKAAEEAARRAAAEQAAAEAAAVSDDSGGGEDSGDEAPPPVSGGGYAWPLCGIVTSEFGWRWGRQHEGLDIDDNRTDRITAAQSGTVIYAQYNSGGYGNLVLVQHGDGVVTAYAHQRSMVVSTGESVSRGELLGYVGSTGNSTGPHLHFETRVGGSSPVDPRQFLSGSGC